MKKKKLLLPVLLALLSLLAFTLNTYAETPASTNLVPVMTSNTAPSGIVTSSSIWSSNHQPYQVFDGKDTDYGWSSAEHVVQGWISYEFETPVTVNAYSLQARNKFIDYKTESPKDWTFEGWDGNQWIVLDTQSNITGWESNVKKEFSFSNEVEYKKYRLNITKNNGNTSYVTLGAMEMMYNPVSTPTEPTPTATTEPAPTPTVTIEPTPTASIEPTPTATPEESTGNRAMLIITMDTGLEKEFDLPIAEVNAFLDWYDARDAGTGPAKFAINKHDNNKGPFSKRTDYVIFDKILTFEVNEY